MMDVAILLLLIGGAIAVATFIAAVRAWKAN